MANFFDRFDSASPAPPPPPTVAAPEAEAVPPGGNFFDQFDAAPGSEHTFGRSAKNVMAGANTGLIAQTLGAPVDLATAAINIVPRALGYQGIENPIGGSESINALLGKAGVGTAAVPAQDAQDRIEQGIGQGVGSMVAPYGIARVAGPLAAAGSLGERAAQTIGSGNAATNAAIGGVAGGAGAVASELAPDGYKPLANIGGQLVGGGAMAGGMALAQGAGRVAAKGIDYFRLPATTAGQQQLAGERILGAASDPEAMRTALNAPDAGAQIIPGSQPTTAEVTGDRGVSQLARSAITPENFKGMQAERNSARIGALESTAAADADPAAVGQMFQRQLDQADTLADTHIAALQRQAQAAGEAVGGRGAPQEYGQQMRGLLDQANKVAKARESQLWQAIDPNGELGVNIQPAQDAAHGISSSVSKLAAPMQGEEKGIFDSILQSPRVVPFSDIGALWSRIGAATRAERIAGGGESVALRRLNMLRDAITQSLRNGTEDVAHIESVPGPAIAASPLSHRLTQASQGPGVGNSVFTPTGREVGIRHEVVDLAGPNAPIASHTIDRDVNPAYPQELQPRDRSRAASATQIRQMASSLQPERLGASASPQEGAPIIGPDNVVESGNGRILALAQAYNQGFPSAGAYRAWLESHGYDTTGMQYPALLRRRITELSPEERVAFTRESNIAPTASLSATEQAAADAEKLRPALLSQYAGGDITRAGNRDFARSFVRSVANPGEEGALFLPDGTLSTQGAQRMRNALLHRAYNDRGLVGAMAEAGDEDLRAFGGALGDAAGEMSRLRGAIESGQVPADRDLAPSLVDAARLVKQARERGHPLFDTVAQQDAFNPISAQTEEILKAAYGENLRGRVSRARLGSILAYYADEAERQGAMADLLGERASVNQMLSAGAQRYERNRGTETAARKPQSASFSGAGIGESGAGAQRPGSSETGPAGTAGRAAENAGSLAPETGLGGFDQAAVDRYAAAKAATAERKQTFRAGTVGDVLAPGPNGTPFRVANSAVPEKFASTPEGISAYVNAAGGRPEAVTLLHDYLASTLKRLPDGSIDPGAFPTWLQRNRAAVDAFPELKDRFGTAAQAQQAVEDAAAARAEAKRTEARSAATLFVGNDPVTAVRKALSVGGNGEPAFRELADRVRGNPDAEEGLRRAVVQSIRQRMESTVKDLETGQGFISNNAFQKFIDEKLPALRHVFTDAQISMIRRIGEDMSRENSFTSGSKMPGSNTPQDLGNAMRFSGRGSLLQRVGHSFGDLAIFGALEHAGGIATGIAALALKKVAGAMREAGLKTVDGLVEEAMLNPALARTLIAKVTPKNEPHLFAQFLRQLRTIAVEAPQNAENRDREALDAVTRSVSAMAPGTAVTARQLAQLSGRSDITGTRARLVSRGLIEQRNGRYLRADTANAAGALAPKEVAQPKAGTPVSPAFNGVYDAIRERAPTLRRQSLLDINREIEGRSSPLYGTYKPGGLIEHAAAVGEGSPMTHDVLNLYRRSGAIPRDQWSVLAGKSDGWAKQFGIDGPPPAIRREEAVAQAFNRWRSGDIQLPPGLRRIMRGISDVTERAVA